jgi:hypothetical protein
MIIKPRKKLFIAVFAFLVLFCLPVWAYADNTYGDKASDILEPKKNILLLNSYNQGLAWTLNQDEGIIDTIKKSYANCSIYVEDMDWKNYPTSGNLSSLYEYYKFKYSEKHLDLIITTDDAAFNFALRNRLEMFSNAPIVFSGVNQDRVAQVSNIYPNFTGVIEKIDPTETIKMALKINPSIKNVYVIYDNSESGISTGELVVEKGGYGRPDGEECRGHQDNADVVCQHQALINPRRNQLVQGQREDQRHGDDRQNE